MQHWCRRLAVPDVEALIEAFLDDLSARSGFAVLPMVRSHIRADWRAIAAKLFTKPTAEPDPEPE